MRLAEIEVENFRSLRKVAFSCGPLTALIGANGTGKSTVLKALEFFFLARELDEVDCAGGDREREVRVTVVFAGFPPAEEARLRPWLDEAGRLPLSRVAAVGPDGRWSCWFESLRRQVPEFQKVRQIAGAPPCAPPTTSFASARASPTSLPSGARPRRRRLWIGGRRPIQASAYPSPIAV